MNADSFERFARFYQNLNFSKIFSQVGFACWMSKAEKRAARIRREQELAERIAEKDARRKRSPCRPKPVKKVSRHWLFFQVTI